MRDGLQLASERLPVTTGEPLLRDAEAIAGRLEAITVPKVRTYMGHTITSCGLSWYVDRSTGKAKVRSMVAKRWASSKAPLPL